MSIRIVLVLMVMVGWSSYLADVNGTLSRMMRPFTSYWYVWYMIGWSSYLADINGAFLIGKFENGEELYMEIPRGFKEKTRKQSC